ncbi:MAG: hypothetical protein ACJ8DV_17640, partial [Microvirga sp.]
RPSQAALEPICSMVTKLPIHSSKRQRRGQARHALCELHGNERISCLATCAAAIIAVDTIVHRSIFRVARYVRWSRAKPTTRIQPNGGA